MFYLIACLLTFVFITQESKTPAVGRKELMAAFCLALVWPVYAVMMIIFYSNEVGQSIADILGLIIEPDSFLDVFRDEPSFDFDPEDEELTR